MFFRDQPSWNKKDPRLTGDDAQARASEAEATWRRGNPRLAKVFMVLTIAFVLASAAAYVIEDTNDTHFIVPLWFLTGLGAAFSLSFWAGTGWRSVHPILKSFISVMVFLAATAGTIFVLWGWIVLGRFVQ